MPRKNSKASEAESAETFGGLEGIPKKAYNQREAELYLEKLKAKEQYKKKAKPGEPGYEPPAPRPVVLKLHNDPLDISFCAIARTEGASMRAPSHDAAPSLRSPER